MDALFYEAYGVNKTDLYERYVHNTDELPWEGGLRGKAF